MTRKDYVLIAATLKTVLTESGSPCPRTVGLVAHELSINLSVDNPRFDRERFLKACGVQS